VTGRERAAVGIVLAMGVLAICTLIGYCRVLVGTPADASGIVMDAQRFRGVRTALPPRGTVGYLSDTAGRKAYYLTQYYLAPVVVAPDSGHEIVVANFASPSAIGKVAAANGLTVERDYANGVALLRRPPR